MTASQSQRKIYNPGQREDQTSGEAGDDTLGGIAGERPDPARNETEEQDGGYGETPVEGPHHNRGDLERRREPGYRESHEATAGQAVSPDGMQHPKNIKSQETVQHTSQQGVEEDQQAPADISGTPVNTASAPVFTSAAASAGPTSSEHVDDAAPTSPASSLTDAELLTAVLQRLQHSASLDLSDVRIAVVQAHVILDGFVPHRFMQHAIEDVVDSCSGVREIDNRIRVRHRPGEDEPTLSIGI